MAQNRLALPVFEAKVYDPAAAKAFRDDYLNYCNAYLLDDDDKLLTLATALRGNARAWLTQHFNVVGRENADWQTTDEAFLKHFTAPVPRANRATMAADCKQKPGEGVRDFLNRCCNLAFEIAAPFEGRIHVVKDVTPPAAGDPPVQQPNFDLDVALDKNDLAELIRFMSLERAIDLFCHGVNDKIKGPLNLDKSWETWEQLQETAIAIEQTVSPHTLDKQLRAFSSGTSTAQTHAVAAVAAPTATPTAAVAEKKKPKFKPKAPPDQDQHRSHSNPVICYYCGGTYHTQRHCLAKQKAAAAAQSNVGAVHQQQPRQQQQQHQQPGYVQPIQPLSQQGYWVFQQSPVAPMQTPLQTHQQYQTSYPYQQQQLYPVAASPEEMPRYQDFVGNE